LSDIEEQLSDEEQTSDNEEIDEGK